MQVTDAMVAKAAEVVYLRNRAGDKPWDDLSPEHKSEWCEKVRPVITAALAEMWRPIEEAPKDRPILRAAYIVPSDEAQRNGSKPFWHIETGRAFGTNLDRWTNVLGERPSRWMPLPPLPRCCR